MNISDLSYPTPPIPHSPTPEVDLSNATDLVCDCGNDTFMSVMKFKMISAITSIDGQPRLVPCEVFTCTACGNIPEILDIPK